MLFRSYKNRKICERQKKNNTGKYLCKYCKNRFKYLKTLRAHQKNRCGNTTNKQFEEKNQIRNKKLNDKKKEKRNRTKYIISNDILIKNGVKKKNNCEYLYIQTYKFSLIALHESENVIVLHGSKGNKLFILKFFKDEFKAIFEKDNWKAINDKKISCPYLPNILYLCNNTLIKTYEGPTLYEIFKFCNTNNFKIADRITFCNIAIDILEIFKILKKNKIDFNKLELDDFTWNYIKKKIVLINFGHDYTNHYDYSNNKIIYFFFQTLFQAYDKDFYDKNTHLHQLPHYNRISTANCSFFRDFKIKKLFSKSIDNDALDDIYNFFSKEIKKNKNNKYRFIWENYFQDVYKNKNKYKNKLKKAFKSPFTLNRYINSICKTK